MKPLSPRGERLRPVMIPKGNLVKGAYYVGHCRNASVARWDGETFHHWRKKFGTEFVEQIKHPEDEDTFDVFVPVGMAEGHEVREVPLGDPADFNKTKQGVL